MIVRRWQPVWAAVASMALCMPALGQPCAAVDAEAEALARGGDDALLVAVASDLGPRGVGALVVRAEAGDPAAVLALGLTSESGALRALRERRIRRQPERALALLALGDATETATVTRALVAAPAPDDRLRAASYLGLLRQVRARELLAQALSDPDLRVRLEAARPLARIGDGKARRVLRELARTAPEPIRAAAKDASDGAPTDDAVELMDELESEGHEAARPASVDAGTASKGAPASDTATLARARLRGADGEALRAAIRVVAQGGARADAAALLQIARRRDFSVDTRALALGTALRACPK